MSGSFEAIRFRYGVEIRMNGVRPIDLNRDNVFAGNNH
jgi:hypothetical protein